MACGKYKTIYICLATSSEVVLDLMCSVSLMFYDVSGHAITKYIACWIMKSQSYDIVVGMDWLKPTNPIIEWLACCLDLTVHAK